MSRADQPFFGGGVVAVPKCSFCGRQAVPWIVAGVVLVCVDGASREASKRATVASTGVPCRARAGHFVFCVV